MSNKKTSVFTNGLIWFGAAISIAEILTGILLAPLGFAKGVSAILLGHAIGLVLMYFVGMIGAKTEKSSMETVKETFGDKTSIFFSTLNIIQLIGWTAIMILSGASAAYSILAIGGTWLWAIIIGALIILWVFIGLKNVSKLNMIAMGGLFIITLILSGIVFKDGGSFVSTGEMSFGVAVELSVAMPLSWLPLISDYTRNAEKKKASTITSAAVYAVASSWMYIIGLGAALFVGQGDIAHIMVSAGLGIAGLLIVVLSTVTTTFLDVYSAGVSAQSITKKLDEKHIAIAVAIIGTLLAVFTPITRMETFLFFIGSVFAPMLAIQLSNHYIVKKDYAKENYQITNIVIWCVGFALYRMFMTIDTPVGSTLPVMLIIICIHAIVHKIIPTRK